MGVIQNRCPASYEETWPPEARGDGTCYRCGARIKVIDQGDRGVIPLHARPET